MDNTILLVDDEEGIRKVLGISLMDMGYTVHTAENGENALEIFSRIQPPIVLTDIKMPGMDGIELLKKIKNEQPDTEVIMITGHGDIDLAIKSLKFEATDFITKPINDDVLEIALKRSHERITMRNKLKEYTENLELLVEEKSRKLIEAERMAAIGETVAGLSHTIKNIAGGLKGGTYVLERGLQLDDKIFLTQGWEMVKGNVDKIKNLSLNLLNYAKFTQVHYEMCDPNRPAREVAELIAPVAKEHKIQLKTDFDERLKKNRFDPEALNLCLLNVVSNAVDACREDESSWKIKEVQIQTLKSPEGGVEYHVTDNGSGMEEEVKQKIFQSFFTTKGKQGTGIGLMLTKKIIDAHQGTIRVSTEKGKGTAFVIHLPEIVGDE